MNDYLDVLGWTKSGMSKTSDTDTTDLRESLREIRGATLIQEPAG